jgi:hypothetical protein
LGQKLPIHIKIDDAWVGDWEFVVALEFCGIISGSTLTGRGIEGAYAIQN